MIRNLKAAVVLIGIAVGVSCVISCASPCPDLVRSGAVRLVKSSPPGVRLMWAEVRQEGDYAVIRGSLIRRGAGTWRRVGHVHVEFIDAEGKPTACACSKLLYVMLRGPGRGRRLNRFEVRTPTAVPLGGTVWVTFLYGRICPYAT